MSDPATEHLRAADPVLRDLIDRIGPLDEEARRRGRPDDAYGALLRAIVGQQLSTRAARAIYARVLDLFGGRVPKPAELMAIEPDVLRAAGLSRAKVAYLRDLAQHVEEGTLELERLPDLPDEEVAAQLTAIKGLGQWTADMFLMFHLGRPDVLPVGDQGIRRAIQVEYRLRKLPDAKRMQKIAKPWRPYRTLASLYLWSSLDNTPA
jgi:DNA-3-methyladenine glycosylase II